MNQERILEVMRIAQWRHNNGVRADGAYVVFIDDEIEVLWRSVDGCKSVRVGRNNLSCLYRRYIGDTHMGRDLDHLASVGHEVVKWGDVP